MDKHKLGGAARFIDEKQLQKELEEGTFLKGENLTNDFKLNRKKRQKKQTLKDVFVVPKGHRDAKTELGPITTKEKQKRADGLKKFEIYE